MGEFNNRDNLRAALAEFLGTFIFVFAGIGAVGAFTFVNGISGVQLLLIGLAHGLALMAAIAAVGRISGGHINPAVTIGALITGNIGLVRAAMYIVAQLAGAVLASLALESLAYPADNLGVHTIAGNVGVGNGFTIEVILTFFLVLAVFATAIDKRGNALLAPLVIGTVVVIGHFVAIPLTGPSMNPARSFGPALVHGAWADQWVYWAGPITGALVAAIGYVMIFGTAEDRRKAGAITLSEPATAAEELQSAATTTTSAARRRR